MKTTHCSYSEISNQWVVVVTTRYQFGSECRYYYFKLKAAADYFAANQ